jgi:hypothetical protein
MLSGSDCNNKRLREATGVKRRDTVGISKTTIPVAEPVKFEAD